MSKQAETRPARAATLHLGGDAYAHPDLTPLVRNLYAGDELLIREHPANPRKGDDAALIKSVKVNGVYSPMKVQRSTGYVLAGNTTLRGILDQGATSAPWVWLEVDDAEARRIMLDDNHVGELGGYDDRMLLESLRAAEAAGDLLDTSYTAADLALYTTLADLPVDTTTGQVDAEEAMRRAGIEDFQNGELLGVYSVTVQFAELSDFTEFCKRLDITRPRKRLWFPEVEDLIESGEERVAAPGGDGE